MSPSAGNANFVETDVAILKNDSARHTKSIEKLETAIEKMSEISNSIARMLAIHEERLLASQNADRDITELVERRRAELVHDIKGLREIIESLRQEVSHDISEVETKITSALEAGLSQISAQVQKSEKTEEFKKVDERLSTLERWRWYMVGAAGALGTVIYFLEKAIIAFISNSTK